MLKKITFTLLLILILINITAFSMCNTSKINYCSHCGAKIEPKSDFCKNCNNILKDNVKNVSWICPECKMKNFNRYCTKCGLDIKTGLLKSIVMDENITSIALLEESSIYAAYDKKQKKILLIDAIKEEKIKEIPIKINIIHEQNNEIKEDIISIQSISKDRRYASIVRNDTITELLDLDKNETKCSFRTESFFTRNCVFTKDCKKFIIALADSTISILDIEQNTRTGLLQGNLPLGISNDGKYLACLKSDANSNYCILIYDLAENRIIGKQDSVSGDYIQFSKDNKSILIASSEGGDEFVSSQLDIINLSSLDKPVTSFWKENGAYHYGTDLKSFSFSPSGNYLVSPGDFNTLIVFNYSLRGDPKRLWGNDSGDIEAFSFLDENKVICLAENELRIYRIDTVLQRDEKIKYKDSCTEGTSNVLNLVKYSDKSVSSLCYYFFEGEGSGQYFITWTRENNSLLYKNKDQNTEYLDLSRNKVAVLQYIESKYRRKNNSRYILSLINTDDNKILSKIMLPKKLKRGFIKGLLKDQQVMINYSGGYDSEDEQGLEYCIVLNQKEGNIESSFKNKSALFWSENGRFILFNVKDKEGNEKTALFDSNEKSYFPLQSKLDYSYSLLDNRFYNIFSPDTKYLIYSKSENLKYPNHPNSYSTLYLLNIENKNMSKGIEGNLPVCYSPDSKNILISTEKGFDVYDTKNTEKKYSYSSNWGSATAFKFFKDGRYILVGLSKGEIDLFKFGEKPVLIASYLGHYCNINSIDIAEDNSEFVSGCNDGTVIRWNIRTELLK